MYCLFDYKLRYSFQYRTSAKAELINFLTFRSKITLAALVKLMEEDIFPKVPSEWAEKTTETLKTELLVSFSFKSTANTSLCESYK